MTAWWQTFCLLGINPDDSLAQDCLDELLKAKAVPKKRN